MLNTEKKKVLLADGGKIGRTRFIPIAPINGIDCIITDKSAPRAELEKIRETGVQIIVA
jgi:DeoR/GlpR family transcriptional regulator of sugar metabolism